METTRFSLEVKALKDRQFEGHGSIFGNVDLGGDIVARGAFAGTLASHKSAGTMPQMFWMHDPRAVPGKWLDMREDEKGLYVKGELAATPLGDEMHTLLAMKAVGGMSIGYRTLEREWREDEEHGAVRVLKAVDLWEVSLVSLAMNPLARVTGAKSRLSARGEYVPTVREFEYALRDAGMTQTGAKSVVSKLLEGGHAFASPAHREGEAGEDDVMQTAAKLAAIMGGSKADASGINLVTLEGLFK